MRKRIFSLLMALCLMLSALPVQVSAAETGYSASAAIPVELGKTYTKIWTKDNDSKDHYIKFTIPEDGYITISYERPVDDEGEAQDLDYEVYNSDGTLVFETNTSDTNRISDTLDIKVPLAADTYYVNTTPHAWRVDSGSIDCSYTIYFTESDCHEMEPNAGIKTASRFHMNETIYGFVNTSSYDEDWFVINIPADMEVFFYFDPLDEQGNTSKDGYISIYYIDSEGSEESLYDWHFQMDKSGNHYVSLYFEAGDNYFYIDGHGGEIEYSLRVTADMSNHTCSYGSGTITREPTCTEDGEMVSECAVCGSRRITSVPATGHTLGETTINTAPNCTESGIQTASCTVCGQTITESIPATGHRMGEFTVNVQPTCTESGIQTASCTICGQTITESLPALGHKFGEWVTVQEATTIENGLKERECSVCGEKETQTLPMLRNPFVDVRPGDYFYEPVLWALSRDITTGMSANTFDPGRTCTRGQVVTFLWRAAGCPEPTSTRNPFTDVKSSAFYYKAVLWAVENGITTGMSPTSFDPNRACTRGHVVTFLHRAAGEPAPTSTSHPFTDVKASGFYYEAVLWAVENGITTGMSATSFDPGRPCTRGQVVTFLFRAYN